ncbi:hypothetical protein, partial [Micromonospora sp. NPDC048830]|uniref:hypothetical protein n=1 Tax=Micromonospora sp. NPDC048830 TaxID=3364257 RepID=UPI0037228297
TGRTKATDRCHPTMTRASPCRSTASFDADGGREEPSTSTIEPPERILEPAGQQPESSFGTVQAPAHPPTHPYIEVINR